MLADVSSEQEDLMSRTIYRYHDYVIDMDIEANTEETRLEQTVDFQYIQDQLQ